MNFAGLVLIGIAVALSLYLVHTVTVLIVCRGIAETTLDHVEERIEADPNAKSVKHKYYVPIYRFQVEGTVYVAESRHFKNDPGIFEIEKPPKVRYKADNPAVCYIAGRECIIRDTCNAGQTEKTGNKRAEE